MDEKHGDPWPDEPADENMSTDPPNSFDRDESDYEPGIELPNGARIGGRREEKEKDAKRPT